jgi:hypothetical protein
MRLAKNEIETFLNISLIYITKCKTSFCYYKNRDFKCDEYIVTKNHTRPKFYTPKNFRADYNYNDNFYNSNNNFIEGNSKNSIKVELYSLHFKIRFLFFVTKNQINRFDNSNSISCASIISECQLIFQSR